jgi:hypothetical protein
VSDSKKVGQQAIKGLLRYLVGTTSYGIVARTGWKYTVTLAMLGMLTPDD